MGCLRWIAWIVEAASVAVAIVAAPVVAVWAFATHNPRTGWIAVAVFVGAAVYALVMAGELRDQLAD